MLMEGQKQKNNGRKLTFGRKGRSKSTKLPPLPYLTRLPSGNLEEDVKPTSHHVSI